MVNVKYNMGPKRPQKPNADVIQALQRTAEQVLGKKASINIVSGKGEHGSPRHRQGQAADLQFIDGSGKLVSLSDPRAKELVAAAGRNGVIGFGAGDEYMGHSTFHMDNYPLSKYKQGMSQTWGSWGKANSDSFLKSGKKDDRKHIPSASKTHETNRDRQNDSAVESHEPLTKADLVINNEIRSPIENSPIPEYAATSSGYKDFLGKIAFAMPKMIELENLITLFLKKK